MLSNVPSIALPSISAEVFHDPAKRSPEFNVVCDSDLFGGDWKSGTASGTLCLGQPFHAYVLCRAAIYRSPYALLPARRCDSRYIRDTRSWLFPSSWCRQSRKLALSMLAVMPLLNC